MEAKVDEKVENVKEDLQLTADKHVSSETVLTTGTAPQTTLKNLFVGGNAAMSAGHVCCY